MTSAWKRVRADKSIVLFVHFTEDHRLKFHNGKATFSGQEQQQRVHVMGISIWAVSAVFTESFSIKSNINPSNTKIIIIKVLKESSATFIIWIFVYHAYAENTDTSTLLYRSIHYREMRSLNIDFRACWFLIINFFPLQGCTYTDLEICKVFDTIHLSTYRCLNNFRKTQITFFKHLDS